MDKFALGIDESFELKKSFGVSLRLELREGMIAEYIGLA